MKNTIVLLFVFSFLFQSCDEIKRKYKSNSQSFHKGIETSYRIDGPANFRTKANTSGDVVFIIYDNVGLDFMKSELDNWFECGFYLSEKTNIEWTSRNSKRTGNQLGKVYRGTSLYNTYNEKIGASKDLIYVSKDLTSGRIILYAYTYNQNFK